MKRKTLLHFWLLLLCMIVGGGTAWAADEVTTIATGTFDGKNGNYTTGWTTTGTGTNRTDCIVIGSGENITSPAFDLSGYNKITISIKARRFGSLSGSKATIDASIGGKSVGTTDATGTNATASIDDITFTPTTSMTAAVLVFTCTNATSAGSTHGAGINTITITGTKSSGGGDTPATYTVTYNANGASSGTVPTDATSYTANSNTATVLGNTGNLAKEHYTFNNWNTKQDGTGTGYAAGQTFTITANTTLYAQWKLNANTVTLPASDTYGTYTMSATNPVDYNTEVTLTYTPATGYEKYVATWSVNGEQIKGNKFTMPDEAVTVTVSVKEKTTTDWTIDFEAAADTYTDWTFTTIVSNYSNSGVTAHGGSKYGSTDGKASGSIQTKEKVNPASFTCYVSKQSTNTSASTWYIQVSSDGKNWTDASSSDATDMSKGAWKEITADLSNYSDVYVRVYYSGSTAVRLIDDLTLSVNGGSSKPSITASNVDLTYNATSGSIAYAINNAPNPAGTLTAAIAEGSTIANFTLGSITSEAIPFTCEANTTASERTATVTLTYTYGDNQTATKTVTITQAGNPNIVPTIAEVRAQGTGSVVTKGIVTSCAGTTGYIQDATAAICVYGSALTVGDEVKVSGTLTTYKGLLEITSPTVEVLSSENTVTPTVKTIAEINSDYNGNNALQGWLVKIEEATVTNIDGKNVTLSQGDNSIIVRFNNESDITFAQNDIVTLTGNIGCFDAAQIANPTNVTVKQNENPYITADNVEIEYNATSGAIAYTIENPATNGSLSASTEAEWITMGNATGQAVSFTCEANNTANSRSATVTLTYTYNNTETVTKDVTVAQAGNPNIVATIAEVRAQGTGDVVTKGIVTSVNAKTAYMQDENAAIVIYGSSNLTVNVGAEVKVEGTLKNYNGLLEITSPAITTLSQNNNVSPEVMTIADVNASTNQGWLVKIEEATVTTISEQNVTIAQGESTIVVRFNSTNDVTFSENDIISLTGNIGCNNNTVQIANPTDIIVKENEEPTINASNVTLEYDATSGVIDYTITNPAESVTLQATTDADWISDITVGESAVTFTTTANEGEADRTATFTLTYTGAENKTVTVTQKHFVVDYATLPFEYDGGKSGLPTGLTASGLGNDYSSSPKLKFDGTGDYMILKINERPGTLSFDINGNNFSGGTFTVQTSEDGETYTDLETYTELGAMQNEEFDNLGENVRYIKWIYTEKSSGNVGLGNITLAKYEAQKKNEITGLEDSYIIDMTKGEYELTFTATATSQTEVKYEVTDATMSANDYSWDGNTLTVIAKGELNIRAYVEATPTYKEAEKNFTVTVLGEKDDPVIVLDDEVTLIYGKTYTIDTDLIEGGEVTITSSNPLVASVNGLVVTAAAVGKATIEVATAENEFYKEGSATFELTVTEDESTEVPVFYETFDKTDGEGGRDGVFSGSVGSSTKVYDNEWKDVNNCGGAYKSLKFGTGSANGTFSTTFSLTGEAVLFFSAAGWANGTNTLTISLTGEGDNLQLLTDNENNNATFTMTNGQWTEYNATIMGAEGEVTLTFSGKRGFIDDIKVLADDVQAINLTLANSGYASYCSPVALDLTPTDDWAAWTVTSVDKTNVTFTKIEGAVPAKTPFIIYGQEMGGKKVSLPLAPATYVPEAVNGNWLEGTLSPTYLASDDDFTYFGLSNGQFVKMKDGVVKANKAYLPILTENVPEGARLSIVFNDEATGIKAIDDAQWTMGNAVFDLQGRRIQQPTKGLYIKQGKKLYVK